MDCNVKFVEYANELGNSGQFLFDAEKMQDFIYLTKEEFLESYSYLTEEEYDDTMKALAYIQGILVELSFAKGGIDMNMEERMAKIKARAIANEDKKRKEEEAKQKRWEEAEESVWQLGSRIANLLDLVNACVKNNIKPYKSAGRRNTLEDNFFEADGIYHHLGFNCYFFRTMQDKKEITELTIKNGGWNGDIDLRVGRDGVAHGWFNTDYHTGSRYTKPRTEDMEKFVKEFDNFEKEFLDFIDNL